MTIRPVIIVVFLALSACATEMVAPGAGPDMPDSRYWRYDDILARFSEWERDHPGLFSTSVIGRTRGGEPIAAARIAGAETPSDRRPAILLVAALHANEANGTGALMTLMGRLLDGYHKDAGITELVNGNELWCVPVANPDGHIAVFSGEEGWRHHRKNGAVGIKSGVDLNRNWDHNWDADPNTDPEGPNYKGLHPFSEPETAVLRDLVEMVRPLVFLDIHSPGKVTPPNKLFWPWLVKQTGETGPDADAYRAIAQAVAARTETETDGVFLDGDWYGYDTLPKAQNWVYRTTGQCALLMEITTRCWWEGAIVDAIAERASRGCYRLLELVREGPGLTVAVSEAGSGGAVVAEVAIAEHHDEGIGPRTTDPQGIHRRLLCTGTVTVTVSAPGYLSVAREVRVGSAGWTRAAFILEPEKP